MPSGGLVTRDATGREASGTGRNQPGEPRTAAATTSTGQGNGQQYGPDDSALDEILRGRPINRDDLLLASTLCMLVLLLYTAMEDGTI
ncbi:hypothetical protein [Halomicrobium mukohataei]|uniref:Uncharacterized protein n=1 Tax=Halomicrobium mukohataei (strain ATCC 700874 / DSM 12286 / JCM 9738 / NCIMB 13541) TaxID=485914 RepID=C7NYF2_HALMD|nr:hypothetical protein [Halomicrobium mukohataei]ACV46613.1 hypothetical protein Hmuk_0479 [Halomicrobium mukohataei DSM 12286]